MGEEFNRALFKLTDAMNEEALTQLSPVEYQRKMIKHWWENKFPNEPFPTNVPEFYYDLDFEPDCQNVQSVNI